VDHICYIQVDNALAASCDPRFVGYHLLHDSEFSCKSIAKHDPFERVGNFARVDGRPSIVEYTEIPAALASERGPDGRLLFGHGNPGLFLWSRRFIETQVARSDLPVHRAHKKIPCIDAEGNTVRPVEPNGFKLELFVIDALPAAQRSVVIACDRDAEFAPVKNADGPDSPQTARALISRLHRSWVEQSGGHVAPGAHVEINPLYALDATELAQKHPNGLHIERDTYLG
jgi:UDP-N-acetylglucosamine/UDP-N-acetylgalactosamine diphosphorylase